MLNKSPIKAKVHKVSVINSIKQLSYNQKIMKSIFEKIIDRDVDADIVFEDGLSIVFKDINPVAPKHFLVVPKKKISSMQTVSGNDLHLFSHIFSVIQKLAVQENLVENGYRVVTNVGDYGGQTVDHLHFHVIGGRNLRWPPG